MALGEQLRRARKRQGLSLSEVARRANISKAYLSQLEHGESKQPSYEVLGRLALVLGDSVEQLTGQPGIWDPANLGRIPASLKTFAHKASLPEGDLTMLAKIHFRGKRPQTPDDWAHIYETIKRTIR